MNIENLSEEEIRRIEAGIRAKNAEVEPNYQHYGSVENLSDEETRRLEAEIRARGAEVTPTYQHYGSVENLSDTETRRLEAEIKAKNAEVKPTYQHYGSVENLSDDETRRLEAEIRARNSEIRPSYQHYGSVENLGEAETRVLEAQVAEKRQQDVPHREFLNGLIANPSTFDSQKFGDAVIRSMQSNGIMKDFISRLIEEISKATYGFRSIEKTDLESVKNQQQRIETLINLYVRYLYALKNQGWSFNGNAIGLETIDSELLDNLWQIQKQFDLTLTMPIPKNLGEYYGQAFERKGKMVPAITLMYDDLKDKEVNWHQVLIYKENELTPKQRYMQRKQEAVNQFDSARQEEIKNTLVYSHAQTQLESNSISDMENSEQIDSGSMRM